ncbi:hypothetical protein GIB67_019652 [Kingdonia uniflora]|uniref:UDP-glycosyltransferases domain-containing protein n=1 Tax=Kingdonia uniflora TaxID=39325 RepID=A0A7J7P499_9MAGN|nr:hypothetical protein GIB67_019652 [Kingdonia uniflora]
MRTQLFAVTCGVWRKDSLEWLGTQPIGSVVYVSFGSIVALDEKQMEEIAWGLLNSGSRFLWVIKPSPMAKDNDKDNSVNGGSSVIPEKFLKEAEGEGKVVPWCPQDRVLAHPSVACFVTHCGWNSSWETLSSKVPVVVFPQWGDQVTDAKFLDEVYGMGVRLGRGELNTESLSKEDVERCVFEVTQGLKSKEMKKNAMKLKKSAEEAVAEGGSSQRNLQAFINDILHIGLK